MLWDVYILFMEVFDEFGADLLVLEHLLDLPPSKFLELRTDQLLTGYFRGGLGVSRVPREVGSGIGTAAGLFGVCTQAQTNVRRG